MPFFGIPIRNGLPIGLGSVAGFGVAPEFSPADLFLGGVNGAWYDPSDSTTLFSDPAGTTPVAQPGAGAQVVVGAMLDERAPSYSTYFDGNGDELNAGSSANFAFGTGAYTVEFWVYLTAAIGAGHQPAFVCTDSTGGWIIYSATGGLVVGVRGVSNDYSTSVILSTGTWNHVVVVRASTGTNQFSIYVNGSRILNTTDSKNWTIQGPLKVGGIALANYYVTGYMSNVRVVKGTAVYDPTQSTLTVPTSPLTAITGTSLLTCGATWSGNPAITVSGNTRVDGLNPFVASPVGNHAISYNSTTARPELSARVNLLTYSEQFDNGAWTNLNAATNIVANATTAPNGTNTADFFRVAATTNTDHLIRATNTVSVAASTYILTWRIKANGITRFRMAVASETSLANRAWVNVNLSTLAQTGGTDGSGFTFVSSDVTLEDAYGFQTVSLTYTTTVGTAVPYIVMQDASGNFTFAGTVDTGLYIWGADLRPANIGANVPAYQRIADQYTYDNSASFPRYLRFDGVDDGMSTPANLNLSSTDKATVFAGVRKLSDAAFGVIAETSPVVDSNNGAMAIGASIGATQRWFSALRGTSLAYYEPATYAAPITNVLATSFNIAGAGIADEIVPRVNGIVEQENPTGASAGTGNFGTYPLYIGARNNASLWLNGNIYSLIVRGAATDASTISATETWVAGKTGITI